MAYILDSNTEDNHNATYTMHKDTYYMIGNSFTCDIECALDSAKFYLMKAGSPPGNIYAKLYSHSGTYGLSSIGDSLLATSDPVPASTPGATESLITFTFTGAQRRKLAPSTYYVIICEYNDGDGANAIGIGRTPNQHDGNAAYYDGSWMSVMAVDYIFYVYGDDIPIIELKGGAGTVAATVQRLSYIGNKSSYLEQAAIIYGLLEPIETDQNIISLNIMGQAYRFLTNGEADILASDRLSINSTIYDVRGIRRYNSKSIDYLEVTLELSVKK